MPKLSVPKLLLLSFGLVILFTLVGGGTATQRISSLPSQESTDGGKKVEVFKSALMPPNSTVAIAAVRNLNNKHWLRDLEVEIKNNYQQPIYYLEVEMILPDLVSTELDGNSRVAIIPLIFGRKDLRKLDNVPTVEDVPIRPGESATLKLRRENWKGIESYLTRKNIQASTIETVQLRVLLLSFGDGSGVTRGKLKSVRRQSSNDVPRPKAVTAILKRTITRKTTMPESVSSYTAP